MNTSWRVVIINRNNPDHIYFMTIGIACGNNRKSALHYANQEDYSLFTRCLKIPGREMDVFPMTMTKKGINKSIKNKNEKQIYKIEIERRKVEKRKEFPCSIF